MFTFVPVFRQSERQKAKIYHLIVYSIFFITFLLNFLNTTWIAMNILKKGRSIDFISNFGMNILMDYLCYEVTIISTKCLLFFFIIRNEEVSWWKRCFLSFISALPWAFSLYG